MKKFWLTVSMLLALTTICVGAEMSVESPADCQKCGMNRTKFARSRMIVTYSDGSSGTCSINCVAVDLQANRGKEAKSFQVGDYDNKKLIDAKTATWVIGGKKRGVMTPVAKWAFADKNRAEKFIKENGGRLVTFTEVLKASEMEQEEQEKPKAHGGHKM